MEEMEQKEKVVQTGPCSTQLEVNVGNVNEEVGAKHHFREEVNVCRTSQQDRVC